MYNFTTQQILNYYKFVAIILQKNKAYYNQEIVTRIAHSALAKVPDDFQPVNTESEFFSWLYKNAYFACSHYFEEVKRERRNKQRFNSWNNSTYTLNVDCKLDFEKVMQQVTEEQATIIKQRLKGYPFGGNCTINKKYYKALETIKRFWEKELT